MPSSLAGSVRGGGGGAAASTRLYAEAANRKHRAATAVDKENARKRSVPPHINERSRALEREGDVGERLYEEAQAKAAKQQAARDEVEAREWERMGEGVRAVPAL